MTIQDAINKFYDPNDPNAILNWNVFNESIVVSGTTGSGKSTLVADEIVGKLEGAPLWILDPKLRFTSCGIVVTELSKLNKEFQYVYQPKNLGEDMFIAFFKKVLEQTDLHVIVDEIHLWLSKQKKIQAHYDTVMSKRNDGVSMTSITTDTKAIPNYILKTVTHVYSLRYNLRDDVDWLADYIGEKAEFLLPSDKRNPIETGIDKITFKDMPMLKEYSYVYRDLRKKDGAIIGGFEEPLEPIVEIPMAGVEIVPNTQEQLGEIKLEPKGEDDQQNVNSETNQDDKIDSKIL